MKYLHTRMLLAVIFLFIQLVGMGNNRLHPTDPLTEVKESLASQVLAWNAGELETAMSFYWNSKDLLWINKRGISKGYQPVLDSYLEEYKDRTKMGIYSVEFLDAQELSAVSAYIVIRWKIELNQKTLMGGVSSQVWKKMEGRWVITSEHAS